MVAQPIIVMRKLHLFAFASLVAISACVFNPQPDPPGTTVDTAAGAGGAGGKAEANTAAAAAAAPRARHPLVLAVVEACP
jgi:hypothetical protein